MKALLMSLMAVALTACASAPVVEVPRQLFADDRFVPPVTPVTAADVFVMDQQMRDFAEGRVREQIERNGSFAGLFETLKRDLRLDYDAAETRTAAQTFAWGSGNCLSLVMLTAAFAKYFGVQVYYQSVMGWDSYTRTRGIAFLNSHVNLRVGPPGGVRPVVGAYEGLTIDFVAPTSAKQFFTRQIDEETLLAMYLNNRAAEMLVFDDVDSAYWWARKAIEQAPLYLVAANTLGVIYLHHGDLPEAERAFRYVLAREPVQASALTNLSHVLRRTGRTDEAAEVDRRIVALEPYPPFYFLDQGQAALDRGEDVAALELFERELERQPYNDEVHFAIAQANLRLGDLSEARKHLGMARDYSPTRNRRDIYGAKLVYLKAMESN